MTYQEQVWNYLKAKNLPEKSISAIMGNIQQESGFDPTIIESTTGIGFGLCQWSYSRRTQLEAYGTDINHQLDFLWSELTGENLSVTGAYYQYNEITPYLSHTDFMSGNGSIADLTSAFCFCWERPNPDYANLSYRQSSAVNYYNQFTGTGGTTGTYVKLISPYWYNSINKISFSINKFLLVAVHGNVALIKNENSKRCYYVNKSSIRRI